MSLTLLTSLADDGAVTDPADEVAQLRQELAAARASILATETAVAAALDVAGVASVMHTLAGRVEALAAERDEVRASEVAADVRRRDVTIADLRAQVAEMARGLTDLAARCERAESERDAARCALLTEHAARIALRRVAHSMPVAISDVLNHDEREALNRCADGGHVAELRAAGGVGGGER